MNSITRILIDGPDQILYQWDRGQRLLLRNAEPGVRVDFARCGQDKAASVYAYAEGEGVFCQIPDGILMEPGHLRGYLYEDDGDRGETVHSFLLPVISRPKPEDYVEPEEELLWHQLKEQIDEVHKQIGELENRPGGGSGGNAEAEDAPALDVGAYGMPLLDLTGDTSAMAEDNAVSMEYVYGDRTGSCTVQWQGGSSVAYPKKNYTVVFDVSFEAAEGWGEQSKYCLKADFTDFTHARNVVSAKLWGQIVRSRTNGTVPQLEALPNGGAIDGFPCVVRINGQFMGIYSFNTPKDPWLFGMGSGQDEAMIRADVAGNVTGFKSIILSGGTDFAVEYVSDGHDADWVRGVVNSLIHSVNMGNGSNIDTLVARYADISSAIDYFIFTVLLRGGEMTLRNYILGTYDGEKLFFSAYDMDSTYGNNKDGTGIFTAGIDNTSTAGSFAMYAECHKLMGLLYEHKRDAIRERYLELRKTVMSEENVERMFVNYAAGIPAVLLDEEARLWPAMPAVNSKNVAQILNWYRNRCRVIDGEMGVGLGAVPADCLPKAVRPSGTVTLDDLMDALAAAGYLTA